MLPGTLLGLFPGIINDSNLPKPPTPKRGLKPYLPRSDGYWLDYKAELPYPIKHFGDNVGDMANNIKMQAELRGIQADEDLV